MTTNGSRMSPERFATLVEKGMRSFNFSLNAATAETHSQVMRLKGYDSIVENLRAILELKQTRYPDIRVHASFVVCTLNEHEVFDFVAQWEPLGVTQVWLHPVNNRAGLLGMHLEPGDIERFSRHFEGDDRVVVDIFREASEEGNLCKIAKSLIFISAEGETRLCAMDYQRVTGYGRVQDKNLQQSHFEKLRAYATGKLDAFCQGCDFCPAELRGRSAPALAVVR
jgi:MoaA/NifB/PqqE/SkfB family radical SAM enzyme